MSESAGMTLRLARVNANITLKSMAKICGISPQCARDIEKGHRTPGAHLARRLLNAAKADKGRRAFCASRWGSRSINDARRWQAIMNSEDDGSSTEGAADIISDFLDMLDPSDFEGEPINWGDLTCVDVRVLTEHDALGYQKYRTVFIEEASPNDCPTLCERVRLFCEGEFGWPNVEVTTEW